jgi:hypothetical protein
MDPYLERPSLWPDVHLGLIRAIQVTLTRLLAPRYFVMVEERTYLAAMDPMSFLGRPDAAVVGLPGPAAAGAPPAAVGPAGSVAPLVVDLPMIDEIRERYLEIRDTGAAQVITVIEILSPSNKLPGDGRAQYLRKRESVLGSQSNLVEIDLLRSGQPMPTYRGPQADYRVLVSRAWQRPHAHLYAFGVQELIPACPIPLRRGEDEPMLDLGDLLHRSYDEARYDLRIDYGRPPDPPLPQETAAWAVECVGRGGAAGSA